MEEEDDTNQEKQDVRNAYDGAEGRERVGKGQGKGRERAGKEQGKSKERAGKGQG
jgi:hypothetical protein